MCCEPVLREHPALAPSSAATERQADLDPVPSSVGVARSLVRETLAGFDSDAREVALLLTSELVTNAILHARTPVQLGVLVDGDRALVCVADRRSAPARTATTDPVAAAWPWSRIWPTPGGPRRTRVARPCGSSCRPLGTGR